MLKNESLKPRKNSKAGIIRRFFDLQICSTYRTIKKKLNQSELIQIKGKVLDVGCGDQPYRTIFPSQVEYKGIDWGGGTGCFEYIHPDVTYYDGKIFPFMNNTYDMVFHTEVTEHVEDLNLFFNECYRVLKNEGELLFSIPFAARYHYIPFDYWRLTPSALKMLLQKAGFKNIEVISRSTDICVASYKVLTIGYRLFFSKKIFKMIVSVILSPIWSIALLIGQFSLHFHIGSEEDCLGYIVYCKK